MSHISPDLVVGDGDPSRHEDIAERHFARGLHQLVDVGIVAHICVLPQIPQLYLAFVLSLPADH